jgi:hypothetical protein
MNVMVVSGQDGPITAADTATIQKVAELPHEVGWLLVYLGVLGLVVPGVIGFPFLIAGGAVLTPGGPARFSQWAARKPRPITYIGLRQIARMIDDLDRRYPPLRRTPR